MLWRTQVLAYSLWWVCVVSAADEEPFVSYPPAVAAHLHRLHGGPEPRGKLAFRPDFPGGFPAWQQRARAQLVALLGLPQIEADNAGHRVRVELGELHAEDGYTRQRGTLESEPGMQIPFWLLQPQPRPRNRSPLVLCAHGHDRDGWNTYAGVYRDPAHREATLRKQGDIGVQAVQRGWTVLVPATRGLAKEVTIPDVRSRHGDRPCRAQLVHCLLAGRTPIGERVWDTQRLLDWALANVAGVDEHRVAMLGNSGGGVLTVYVAALDERIGVAIPSCSFTAYTSAEGFVFHCDCCLVPRIQVELAGMADVGALAAPRALLSVHGRADSLHTAADVERAMARVASIYRAARAPRSFAFVWGEGGHRFYPEPMWTFLDAQWQPISAPHREMP